MAHVAGYTVLNDVSGRRTQRAEKQWLRAKGFDGFGPCGPWIVTADEAPDPHALSIECRVNGELRQSSDTGRMIFRIPFLVSYLSATMTLEPGDIISTGTPGGVGEHRDPPVFLKDGDVVTCTIEGIGTLENPVRAGL
jgi:2-keto-4-pentenoate hydratase/2-oxohepta-3-ene-1,7-dioic acid hydratase in catechol pathway